MKKFITAIGFVTVFFFAMSAVSAPAPKEKTKKEKKEAKEEKEAKKPKKEVKEEGKEEKAKGEAKEEKAKGEAKEEKAKGEEKKAKKEKAEKPKDPKKVAKEFFDSGKKKFDEGNYQGALDDFLSANNTLPNPFVYLKIADCYEKLQNIPEAIAWLNKFANEKPDAQNIQEIKGRIEKLSATPGKISAATEPGGAKIILDGQDTGKTTPAEVDVAPGQHSVEYRLDGYVAQSKTLEITPGGKQELSVTLEQSPPPPPAPPEIIAEEYPEEEVTPPAEQKELPPPPPPPQPKTNKGVWAAAGIAGVGIVSATVFGILALNQEADFEDKKDKGPEQGQTETQWLDDLDSIKSKGRAFAIACDVSWGVAAAATLTGIILYYVTNKPPKENKSANLTINPVITKDGAGAGATIKF